jgi:hypothetical protein
VAFFATMRLRSKLRQGTKRKRERRVAVVALVA